MTSQYSRDWQGDPAEWEYAAADASDICKRMLARTTKSMNSISGLIIELVEFLEEAHARIAILESESGGSPDLEERL